MPNLCFYSMCIKGKKDNVVEFIKIIQAGYNYISMTFDDDRHFCRVFDADVIDGIKQVENDIYQAVINGNCAWSVRCCMFADGYYEDLKRDYPNEYRCTTLPIESERLNLDIEVFSEETGMCFQEHYVIKNGEVVVSECVDYEEYWHDDFETKEEAEEEYDIEITDEEWNNGEDYFSRGGFESWAFSI